MAFQLDNIAQSQHVKEKKPSGISELLQKDIRLSGKVFSNKKKAHFYTELSVLLKAGINLKEALTLIRDNEKRKALHRFFGDIINDIVSGSTFSEAVQHKKDITEYEYYSLQIGEETGTLAKVSESLGSFFDAKNTQRRNLINALSYPIIIFVTAILVVAFMLRLVVPMFQGIFEQNQVALPAITSFIIGLSGFLKDYGYLVFLIIIAIVVFRKAFARKPWFRKAKDRFIAQLPFAGRFVKTVYVTQFIQAMALLSSAKVPVVNSIALVKKMIAFYPLQEALQQVEAGILSGVSLSDSLKQHRIFDARMIALVKVAEETNKTEFIFERLHQQYSIAVQQRSKTLATLTEPLIIVFIGILVGVILIAMYLPMFKLSSVLG